MMKKGIVISIWMFFMVSMFFTQGFAQKEVEVIGRYDYSSPKASFESLKKAIETKDIEGIIIHDWQGFKLEKGSRYYGVSFEDALAQFQSKNVAVDILCERGDRIWTDAGPQKLTEFDFVEEKEREQGGNEDIKATGCFITLKQKDKDIEAEAFAMNYDGTEEWWIIVPRYGE